MVRQVYSRPALVPRAASLLPSVYYPGNLKVLLPSSEALGQQYSLYYHIIPSTEGMYHTYIMTEYPSGMFYSTVLSKDSLLVLQSTSTMEVDCRVYGGGLLIHYYISTIHLHCGGGS
jgi:hypothetical protein